MSRKKVWKWTKFVSLVCLGLLVLVPSASAFEGRSAERVVIDADEVIEDDLYVAADTLIMNGVVQGDVFAVGNTLEINGTVEGDVVAAGQNLIVNGAVMDDVRFAGTTVTLGEEAQIMSDLLAAGFGLEMKSGAVVESDLLFAGAQALMAGNVGRDASFYVNGLELRGEIGRNLTAEVGAPEEEAVPPTVFIPNAPAMPTVAGGLHVSEAARIGGDFNYTTPERVIIPSGIVVGDVVERIEAIQTEEEAPVVAFVTPSWYFDQIRRLIALFLIGLLLVWLAPKGLERVADVVEERPLPSLGWGLITLVVVGFAFLLIVVATVLLAVLFGTITLANLVGTVITLGILLLFTLAVAFVLTLVYGTAIAISYLTGRYILAYIKPAWAEMPVAALALGLFLFVVLTAVPFIGGWINFAVILLGLGALWLLGRSAYERQRASAPTVVPPKPSIRPTGA